MNFNSTLNYEKFLAHFFPLIRNPIVVASLSQQLVNAPYLGHVIVVHNKQFGE
jgi:hypothetical protein